MVTNSKLGLVQMLRGIAALLVLLYHIAGTAFIKLQGYSYLFGLFSSGWVGVDIFFVLSGFIIFYIHEKDISNKNKISSFIIKRLIRIYPTYWIVTIAVLPVYFLFPQLGVGYEQKVSVIFKSLFLIPQSHDPIVGPGWSLCFEMFFYLLFGIAIYVRKRVSIYFFSTWIFVVLCNLFSIIHFKDNFVLNFIFNQFNLEFILGCLVAYFIKRTQIKYQEVFVLVGILGLMAFCSLANRNILTEYGELSRICFGLSASILLVGLVSIDLSGKMNISKVFLMLGDASYSIYLTHTIVASFLFKVFNAIHLFSNIGNFAVVTIIMIFCLIFGFLFYVLIEKPILVFLRKLLLARNVKMRISGEEKVVV